MCAPGLVLSPTNLTFRFGTDKAYQGTKETSRKDCDIKTSSVFHILERSLTTAHFRENRVLELEVMWDTSSDTEVRKTWVQILAQPI